MLFQCFLVSCIYGLCPILHKHTVGFISMETLIVLLNTCYFMITLPFMFYFRDKVMNDVSILLENKHLFFVIALSATLMFMFGDYIYIGLLEQHKSYLVTSIVATYPLITVLLGYYIFNEQFKTEHLSGILLIILGVIMLNR